MENLTMRSMTIMENLTIKEWVRTAPYKDVLDTFLLGHLPVTTDSIQMWLLERIKDEDLPLFIHYPWKDPPFPLLKGDTPKQLFLKRLKGEQLP